MKSISILTLSLLFLFSCSTLNTVIKDKENGGGTSEVYDVSYDQAWEIAKKSFRWGGADAIEEYKEDGYMLTSKGMNLVSSGSVMGAWIEPMNGKMKVTVVTKRRIQTQIATGLTESKFQKYFKEGVAIVKSGKSLPMSAPEI